MGTAKNGMPFCIAWLWNQTRRPAPDRCVSGGWVSGGRQRSRWTGISHHRSRYRDQRSAPSTHTRSVVRRQTRQKTPKLKTKTGESKSKRSSGLVRDSDNYLLCQPPERRVAEELTICTVAGEYTKPAIAGIHFTARPGNEHKETEEIAGNPGQRVEAVRQQLEEGARHERSALHVTRRYATTNP